MKSILEKLCKQQPLSREESYQSFMKIMSGEVLPVQMSAFLALLRAKGETAEEITGAASALLSNATPFESPQYDFADLVGTGGDNSQTINISTAAALLVSEMGLPVAKHGNVSVSSKCGSADVLRMLGVNLEVSPKTSRKCLDEVGFCFLYAPRYHAGFKHAKPVRSELKIRTVFNILGPLVNPAKPPVQMIGVYKPDLCLKLADVLLSLNVKKGLVVHGSGLDELALHGSSKIIEIQDGKTRSYELTPPEAGLPNFPLDALKGGAPEENAETLKRILSGRGTEAQKAAVALNAGALLKVYGKFATFKEAVASALLVLETDRVYKRLKKYVELTQNDS